MKNTFLKTISKAALAILMLAVFAPIWVSAQEDNGIEAQKLEDSSDRSGNEQGLEGSWSSMITFRNCETGAQLRAPFPGMNTFMQGGTMQEFGVGSGFLRGPGHGIWNHQLARRYTSTFQFFLFNADNTYARTVQARRQMELSRSGDSYTSTNINEFFDPNGNLVLTTCATETATRFE
jgi:hypothetical protein